MPFASPKSSGKVKTVYGPSHRLPRLRASVSSASLIGRRISPACSFPYVPPEMSWQTAPTVLTGLTCGRGPGPATRDCPGSCSALSTERYFNIHTRRSVCARRSRPEGSAGFFGQPALEPSPPRRSFAARRSSEAVPIQLPRSAMRLGTQTATGSFAMTLFDGRLAVCVRCQRAPALFHTPSPNGRSRPSAASS